MARRVIGLDIGTNAVTVAEMTTGATPRLTAFGQVALPREAMREGEVVDEALVVDAVRRLRAEVGFRKGPVRVGLASPRLIVRQVEMPVMSREDLAGALRFQAQDLIPIPLDEAVLDFTILDTYTPTALPSAAAGGAPIAAPEAPGAPGDATATGSEPVMRVLIAAIQQTTVTRLVEAVERAGLPVESVDLVPLALIRALGQRVTDNGPGAEGIVSIGGGVTCVVVHDLGTPRFVRVLATGGRVLTDAIASTLELPFETAESLKRQIGSVDDEVVNQARTAIDRPLTVLLDEIRSSLDYYRNQPGASRLLRVQLTGGGARLDGVRDRLANLLGVPVTDAAPREHIEIGDIGFDPSELPRLDPYLPAAVGLALGDSAGVPVMNLLPGRPGRVARAALAGGGMTRGRIAALAAAGVVGLLVLLAIPTIARKHNASDINHQAAGIEAQNSQLQADIARLSTSSNQQQQLDALRSAVGSVLGSDVSWARMLNELARTMPNDVWLTGFQGQVTPTAATPTVPRVGPPTTSGTRTTPSSGASVPPPATAVAGSINGTVTFNADGLDFTAVADWLKRVGQMASFENLWVPQAAKTASGSPPIVVFTSTADLTDDARSNRAQSFGLGAR